MSFDSVGVKAMEHSNLDIGSCQELLDIRGSRAGLEFAASIVRQHAIATGELASIILVRLLKDAKTSTDVECALAELHKWVEEVATRNAPTRTTLSHSFE
jgi:hypothetical protein